MLTLKMKELLPAFGEEHYDVNTERAKTIGPSTSSTANTGLQRVNSMRTCSTFPSSSTSCPSGLRGEAAKLFTDLNVGAEPRELHQLFQRYTCWMPHRDAKLDYGNPADVEVPGADSVSQPKGAPTRPRDGHPRCITAVWAHSGHGVARRRLGTGTVITTKKFVDFARSWFKDPKIFRDRNFDRVVTCFRRYLFAWDWMVNETSTEEAWDLRRQNGVEDPYITRKFPFESVMGLFPLVWKFALEKADVPGSKTSPLSSNRLKPLTLVTLPPFTKPTD